MSGEELFYLKWNNFQKNIRRMRDQQDLYDITFACEGKKIGAHKLVLFSCSPYFKNLLKDNPSQHPVFFFQDVAYDTLKAILEYIYLGAVSISNDKLKDFIRVGEALQLCGLSNNSSCSDEELNESLSVNENENNSRKRSNTNDDQIQGNDDKRLRIISEASIGNTLNEEEEYDEIEEEEVVPNRVSGRIVSDSQLQPKAETMEFLEEAAHVIQQTQTTKQPQSITYMTMESFTEKAVVNPQQVTTQYVKAGTSQQPQMQHTLEYKSEDEMWVEKAIESGNGSSQSETSPKSRSSSKNSAAYKANCLTPRSCPICARVYSNVSNLRQHMRLIHNPTAVICPICQKHFNSDLYLKRHYASIHSTGSEAEGGVKTESGTNNTDANNSANWSYQSTEGTIQTLQQ